MSYFTRISDHLQMPEIITNCKLYELFWIKHFQVQNFLNLSFQQQIIMIKGLDMTYCV